MNFTTKTTLPDTEAEQQMADFFGPGQVDTTVRQAIHFCWMALPKDRKTVDEVELQLRRIMDRAIRDFREDFAAFNPALPASTQS
jgi:hypothetical protein